VRISEATWIEELFDLLLPVLQKGDGSHDQAGIRARFGFQNPSDKSQHLESFAESHIVGQKSSATVRGR
jgi:hypothetical protein